MGGKEQYDLFNTAETAALYSKHQPPLHHQAIDVVLAATQGREQLLDIGEQIYITSCVAWNFLYSKEVL